MHKKNNATINILATGTCGVSLFTTGEPCTFTSVVRVFTRVTCGVSFLA